MTSILKIVRITHLELQHYHMLSQSLRFKEDNMKWLFKKHLQDLTTRKQKKKFSFKVIYWVIHTNSCTYCNWLFHSAKELRFYCHIKNLFIYRVAVWQQFKEQCNELYRKHATGYWMAYELPTFMRQESSYEIKILKLKETYLKLRFIFDFMII